MRDGWSVILGTLVDVLCKHLRRLPRDRRRPEVVSAIMPWRGQAFPLADGGGTNIGMPTCPPRGFAPSLRPIPHGAPTKRPPRGREQSVA
jgi:hypothetical protein